MKIFRSTIVLTIVLLLFIWSCKKEPQPNLAADITGSWRWMFTYTGYQLSDSNPRTPQNTGIQEILEFSKLKYWRLIQNNVAIDSGTFFTGQGDYSSDPRIKHIYDSIVFYRNGIYVKGSENYYKIYNDTLVFAAFLRGIYAKSVLMISGTKYYIKTK